MFWFDECLPKIILRAGRQKGRFDNVGARRGIFVQSGLRNHKPSNFGYISDECSGISVGKAAFPREMRVVRRSQGAIREGSNRNMVLGVQRGTLRRYVLWWKGAYDKCRCISGGRAAARGIRMICVLGEARGEKGRKGACAYSAHAPTQWAGVCGDATCASYRLSVRL